MSKARVALLLMLVLAPLGVLPISTSDAAEAQARFSRTYLVTGPPHLSISCAYGDIAVTAWNRKEISVRAVGPSNVLIRDSVLGSTITIFVLQASRIGRLDFELRVPVDTCIHLRNRKGNVSISGLTGHIDVDSGDGQIRFIGTRASSIEARLVFGDIFFDGDLVGEGPYTFQSVKGDIDIALPAWSSFRLSARAMSDEINVGEFILNAIKRHRRAISGVHEHGGPALNLVTYDGRVRLHKR